MKNSTFITKVLFGCLLFFTHIFIAQNLDQTSIKELEEVIQNDLKTARAPGAVVSFIQNDSIIYQKPFGYSNRRTKELVNLETLFLTASLTKTFTTTALLIVCEEKGIDTKILIGTILNNLSPNLAELSIHEILSMSSGIIDYLPTRKKHKENAMVYFEHFGDKLVAENLRGVYSYTNIGHVLAGELLIELTGMSYLESMQKLLLDPLEMESTTFLESEAQLRGYSLAYKKGSKVTHKLIDPFIYAAASMFSNVYDLSRFATCFMNNGKLNDQQVIPENVIKKMATSYTPIGVLHEYLGYPDSAYNYGLIGFDIKGIHFLGHPGETGSQNTLFVMAPKYKGIFVLMSNAGAYPFINSFEKMVETFLPTEDDDSVEHSISDISSYEGKYFRPNVEGNKLDQIAIRIQNKKLYINLGEEDTYPLNSSGKDRFTYKSPTIEWPMEIKFYKNSNGQIEFMNNAWRTYLRMK